MVKTWDLACDYHGMTSPLVIQNGKRGRLVWRLKVAFATLIFCLSVSAVPIYNKLVFAEGLCDGKTCLRKFPFPMATAFLQLSLVSLILAVTNIVGHFWEREQSWIFGPHSMYKLRHIGPVGLLFGFKYGVTNWGLQIVPVGPLVESGLNLLCSEQIQVESDVSYNTSGSISFFFFCIVALRADNSITSIASTAKVCTCCFSQLTSFGRFCWPNMLTEKTWELLKFSPRYCQGLDRFWSVCMRWTHWRHRWCQFWCLPLQWFMNSTVVYISCWSLLYLWNLSIQYLPVREFFCSSPSSPLVRSICCLLSSWHCASQLCVSELKSFSAPTTAWLAAFQWLSSQRSNSLSVRWQLWRSRCFAKVAKVTVKVSVKLRDLRAGGRHFLKRLILVYF